MDGKSPLLLVFAAVLFAGCTMIPEYTRPEAPVPADWPSGLAYKETPSTQGASLAADLQWREFFPDERLQKVIEAALNNNRDLRLAALNVERARALYGIQRAELFPALNATGSGSKERVAGVFTNNGDPMTVTRYGAALSVISWEIDFFGRLRSLSERALEEFLATEQARRSTQILLVSEVAAAYLTLAADRENLRLAETTLETQKSAYNLINRRYEVGLASELDLKRAQTPVDTARGDMARFTQRVAQDENALNLLVGYTSSEDIERLPSDLSGVAPPKEVAAGTSSDVLLKRPDVMAAENLLKAANANIGAARAALFPRIALTTSVGTVSSELSGLFKSGSGTWSFAPQALMPIFDARLWSALDATKTEKEIALVQYEKAIQNAFREVADALAVQGTVDRQIAAQQSLVAASAQTFNLSNARYVKGIDNYLGVLDAQRSLYAAQQGLVALRLTKLSNQTRLYAVLGGGGE
ncbi:MAG: efflux transporter outer membrane subunit [Syntrophobacterales bacterium]|nr:MAG: efflux transporter outer membrane subunit [Syntrophobacterales bacterium]